MSKPSNNPTRLVFTAASKEELPVEFIKACNLPIVTTKGLKSGIASLLTKAPHGSPVVFVITGVGRERSVEAAKAVQLHLSPLAVVNVGTCGINTQSPAHLRALNDNTIFMVSETKTPKGRIKCLPFPPFPLPKNLEIEQVPLESLTRPQLCYNPCITTFVDMEAGFQNEVFKGLNIPFFAFKVATDICSSTTRADYRKSLARVRRLIKNLLSFLETRDFFPKISVIIPVHNRYEQLERAVSSVLHQTYRPHEIIVVDDGSDPPVEPCLSREVSQKIKLIRLNENKGVSFSRNVGIDSASGDWIALLDSDDHWTPYKLANQVAYLREKPFFEIIQCEEIWIRHGKRVNRCKHHEKKEGWLFEKSVELCAISPSAVLIKRSLFDTFGLFDQRFPACEDYEMWLRVTRHKPVGLNQEADLIKFGGHKDQLSARYPAMDRFRVAALLKALEDEDDPFIIQTIKEGLRTRLFILHAGAKKRHKDKAAQAYKEIVGLLDGQKEISWTDYPVLLSKHL